MEYTKIVVLAEQVGLRSDAPHYVIADRCEELGMEESAEWIRDNFEPRRCHECGNVVDDDGRRCGVAIYCDGCLPF